MCLQVTGDDGFTYVYFGGLCECTDGMDVVVKDDDPHHDTQTEGNSFITAEAAAVLSVSKQYQRISKSHFTFLFYIYLPISCGFYLIFLIHCKFYGVIRPMRKWQTYGVSNITLHTLAMVLNTSVVFSMGKFLFCWAKN